MLFPKVLNFNPACICIPSPDLVRFKIPITRQVSRTNTGCEEVLDCEVNHVHSLVPCMWVCDSWREAIDNSTTEPKGRKVCGTKQNASNLVAIALIVIDKGIWMRPQHLPNHLLHWHCCEGPLVTRKRNG